MGAVYEVTPNVLFVQSFTLASKFKSNQETLRSEQTTEEGQSSSVDKTWNITADSEAQKGPAAIQTPESKSAGVETGEDEPTDSQADDSASEQADNNSVIF